MRRTNHRRGQMRFREVVSCVTVCAMFFTGVPVAGAAPLPSDTAEQVTAPSADATALAIAHEPVTCVLEDRHPRIDACFDGAAVAAAQVRFRGVDDDPWYFVTLDP